MDLTKRTSMIEDKVLMKIAKAGLFTDDMEVFRLNYPDNIYIYCGKCGPKIEDKPGS